MRTLVARRGAAQHGLGTSRPRGTDPSPSPPHIPLPLPFSCPFPFLPLSSAEARRRGAQDRLQVPQVSLPQKVLRVLQQGRALLREVQLRRLPQHRGQRRKRSRARHSHSP